MRRVIFRFLFEFAEIYKPNFEKVKDASFWACSYACSSLIFVNYFCLRNSQCALLAAYGIRLFLVIAYLFASQCWGLLID